MSNASTLHSASEQGDLQAVQNLVQQHGSLNSDYVNSIDTHGRTALHYAAQKGILLLARYLILVNAEINVADNNGLSPLDLAIEAKHHQVAHLLRLSGGQSKIQPSVQAPAQDSSRVDQNGLLVDATLINTTVSDIHNKHLEASLTAHVNLAADKLGAAILYASNEWFAPATCLLKPGRGNFTPNTFVSTGQVYDGWETARHSAIRRGGKDVCYIKLGARGIIRGFDIDTNWFTGNYVPAASVDAYCHPADEKEPTAEDLHKVKWVEILPKVPLSGSAQHFHRIVNTNKWTHLRFNVYPDGGVARLKVYGDVSIDWSKANQNQLVDLASILNGGKVVSVSDSFYSSQDNCLMPGRGINMGDGWETRRSRGKNHREWIVIKLGRPGAIEQAEIDTNHFKGNYPYQVTIHGCFGEGSEWVEILPATLLEAHKQHYFEKPALKNVGPVSHVRVTIYPDGGISRIRLNGKVFSVKMMKALDIENSLKYTHKAVNIDDGNFYSFGEISTPRELEKSNLRFVWNTKGTGAPSTRQFYSMKLTPQQLPLSVKRIDRFSSAQTYIPLNASKYLIVACLSPKSGAIPDLLNFGAFIVGGGQAINVKPGVWHQVMALDKDTEFIVASESFLEKKDIESISVEPYNIQIHGGVSKM